MKDGLKNVCHVSINENILGLESQQNHLSGGQHPELVVSKSNKPSDIDCNTPGTEVMNSLLGDDQFLGVGEASHVVVVDQSKLQPTKNEYTTVDDFASSGPLHEQTTRNYQKHTRKEDR